MDYFLLQLSWISNPSKSMSTLRKNLCDIAQRVEVAYSSVNVGCSNILLLKVSNKTKLPRLVAVSKEKPVDLIIEAYKCGQLYFGENKVCHFPSISFLKIKDLFEKSTSPLVNLKSYYLW